MEKLALDEAKGGAGKRIMEGKMKDAKYPEDRWKKMAHTHEYPLIPGSPKLELIHIHYMENLQTGAREGFKFK